jgi:hypothetical protein
MADKNTNPDQLTGQGKQETKSLGPKKVVEENKTGLNHTLSLGPNPTVNIQPAENYISGKENTLILMGQRKK